MKHLKKFENFSEEDFAQNTGSEFNQEKEFFDDEDGSSEMDTLDYENSMNDDPEFENDFDNEDDDFIDGEDDFADDTTDEVGGLDFEPEDDSSHLKSFDDFETPDTDSNFDDDFDGDVDNDFDDEDQDFDGGSDLDFGGEDPDFDEFDDEDDFTDLENPKPGKVTKAVYNNKQR